MVGREKEREGACWTFSPRYIRNILEKYGSGSRSSMAEENCSAVLPEFKVARSKDRSFPGSHVIPTNMS